MKGKTLSEEKARNKVFQLPVWISLHEPWFSEIDSSLSNVNLDLIIFCQALSTQYIARNSEPKWVVLISVTRQHT